MAQKGKIRELQEDLKHSRQAFNGISKYCDKYKEDIKALECKVKNLTIQRVTQQSEPLVAFMKYYKNNVPIGTQKSSVEIVKDYLATNGG